MVCYARPASLLAVIVAVAWLVFAGPADHFFSTAAVLVAVLAAAAAAAAAAVLVFATFMSTRRRRAAAGGCVNCRFQCQHAMTGHPVTGPAVTSAVRDRRLWLVTTAYRRESAEPGQAAYRRLDSLPARSVPVLLPMPEVRVPAPRWPDRPLYRVPSR
jgi:uncharacterized membrane protein YccC